MAAYTWYITPISRTGQKDPWATAGESRPVAVWFGTEPPSDPDAYQMVIIDRDASGRPDSKGLQAALGNLGMNGSGKASALGTDDATVLDDGTTIATLAFTDAGSGAIQHATIANMISHQPVSGGIAAAYKPGVGNFRPGFEPGLFLYVPCFTRGTLIETGHGAVMIEDLAVGDPVRTRDHGLRPIRWIGSSRLDAQALAADGRHRPIRIRRHALGAGSPSTDLLVSPQHRVLVRSRIAQKMFATDEVLIAAKQLCQLNGIDIADDVTEVEYFHILFDSHEVVISNGAETESLFTGPEALKSVSAAARDEILALFPELENRDYAPAPARPLASGRMGRKLAVRHAANRKPLII